MVAAFGLSHPGCRASNQDYFISDPQSGIFILADGMGGVNGGERAACIGAESLYDFLLTHAAKEEPRFPAQDGQGFAEILELGFAEAHRAVSEAARSDYRFQGMGTTLVAAVQGCSNKLYVCSVGDSRAYLESGGKLILITQDQTWVAEVGATLGLSDQALAAHPMRHVLTMAIGCAEELRVHSHVVSVDHGDQVLLCSDGLHGVVDEKKIRDTLLSQKSLDDKAHYLVEAAEAKGAPDNITVVLLQLA